MRTARLVGPTADGTSVVLLTEDGEEISVAVDPDDPTVPAALRPTQNETRPAEVGEPAPTAPVRRPPPRRETPMDTPLSPRDIQTRIRSGESLEDVVAGSGMDAERIERFAAPVLAEREHLALTALGSSVRRRGEASGHRPLRSVVAERLQAQGVDGDDVSWDAWKVGDSQWVLSADYELHGEPRRAEFRFDAQGRFSVAEDDEARWLAGEAPSPVTAVDREDELALVRATRENTP
ncbi:MAG TPA: septation protein SepH, partial [Friedmanniella sp.]